MAAPARRDPGRDHDGRAGLARLCRRADRGGPCHAGRRARPQLDGQSVQILRYTRAVALYAKAELIERHRDYDLTPAGTHQAEDLAPAIDELRRDAQHAVRDLTGRTRTVVDLI
jgi:hypothetical protein